MKWNAGAFVGAATSLPPLLAFMAGLYLATFYVTNNLTMLSGASTVIVVLLFTVPVTVGVTLMNAFLRMVGKGALGPAISVFICAFYVLVTLRGSIFSVDSIRRFFEPGGEGTYIAKFLYYAVPVTVLTFLFRENVKKLIFVLGAMIVTSFAMSDFVATVYQNDGGEGYGSDMAERLGQTQLAQTPNVYLILADGYGSFAYMNENGINVSDFKSYLNEADFHLYEEVFSNYHATTAAMPAMLDMDHHYYAMNFKSSEVSRYGREIVSGRNNLADILRRNDYQIQYIHQRDYLLLHGCSADTCFGRNRYGGARSIFNTILPQAFRSRIWQETSLESVRVEVDRLLETDLPPGKSRFQYIHLYRPGHAPNDSEGICDQTRQLELYSKRINEVGDYLTTLIDSIVSKDPTAVIVLTGDHGPFIENQCQRHFDISTPSEYRDRVGVLTAIRWPAGYDGRFDDQIRTTVNTFRYVLASLAENDAELLSTMVADDVYVLGNNDILMVLENGEMLETVRHFTKEDLRDAHRLR